MTNTQWKDLEKILALAEEQRQDTLNLEDVSLMQQILKQNDQILRI